MTGGVGRPRYQTRVPCDPEYTLALGQAAYSYSSLEWQAICVARKIKPDFITEDLYTQSAGKIGRSIYDVVKKNKASLDPDLFEKIKATVREFWEASELRNEMLHAYPFTAEGGAQRLGRRINGQNVEWTLERLDAAMAFFEDLSSRLNHIFYHELPDAEAAPLALPKPDDTETA